MPLEESMEEAQERKRKKYQELVEERIVGGTDGGPGVCQ